MVFLFKEGTDGGKMTILRTMVRLYTKVLNGGVAIKYQRRRVENRQINVVSILNPSDDKIQIITFILILEKKITWHTHIKLW